MTVDRSMRALEPSRVEQLAALRPAPMLPVYISLLKSKEAPRVAKVQR